MPEFEINTLYDCPEYLNECIKFVVSCFGDHDYFYGILTKCTINRDVLPQGYIIHRYGRLTGYCGLIEREPVLRDDLSPWISPLLIAKDCRGRALGSLLLEFARKQAAKLGYSEVHISTDAIGFLEKYDFKEIGLTQYASGRPTKIYTALCK